MAYEVNTPASDNQQHQRAKNYGTKFKRKLKQRGKKETKILKRAVYKVKRENLKIIEQKFNHRELCTIAANWLRTCCPARCPVVFVEMVSQSIETPDAIGFTSSYSILVECKTSRSDFLADKKKFFRVFPEQGVGDFRFYLCPTGLIKPEEVPEKWGLIWADESGKCKQVKKIIHSNTLSTDLTHRNRFIEKNTRSERTLFYSALRRICERHPQYFYKWSKKGSEILKRVID